MNIRTFRTLAIALGLLTVVTAPGVAQETAASVEDVEAAYADQSFATKNQKTGVPVTYFYERGGVLQIAVETADGLRNRKGKWWVEPDSRFCLIASGDTIFAINSKTGARVRPMKLAN